MSISVHLIGPMRKPTGEDRLSIEHVKGMTVRQVLIEVGYREDELPYFTVQQNGTLIKHDKPVHADASINVFLPLGGG